MIPSPLWSVGTTSEEKRTSADWHCRPRRPGPNSVLEREYSAGPALHYDVVRAILRWVLAVGETVIWRAPYLHPYY